VSKAIKTANKVKHVETTRVHPDDIKLGRNSRMVPAANYSEVVRDRAISIFKHGQLQPAEARRLDDNTLELVYGFTRYDAVNALRGGFDATDPDTGEAFHFHKPDLTLWVKIIDVDADEAFLRSIAENVERKDTSDLQDALAQNELRTTMGWTDSKIARFYGKSNQNRVMDLEKLLRLPDDVQLKVHHGEIALSVALLTLDLTDEERNDIIARSADAGGKVSGPALKNLLRDLYAKKSETPVPAELPPETPVPAEEPKDEEPAEDKKRPVIKRTAKDLERFFEETKADATLINDNAAEILGVLVQWFKGRRTDDYLRTALNEYTS
jgi:ParB-like chromosome segregation protein Spo0J